MIRNALIMTFRYFRKHKSFATVNVLGLAVGLAACLLVYQYVSFEKSFDAFHPHAENIYRVTTSWNESVTPMDQRATTVAWSGPGIKDAFPEVLEYARFASLDVFTGTNTVHVGTVQIEENKIYLVDPSFLTMFSFDMLRGDSKTALNDKSSIVITESIALKYFGEADPIGKTLHIDDHDNVSENPSDMYMVTAVVKDPPANSHFKFDFLLSFNIIIQYLHNGSTYWHWDYTYCYVRLHPDTNVPELERKISELRLTQFGKDMQYFPDVIDFKLQPLRNIHLESLGADLSPNTDGRTLYLLMIVGACVLLTSYINFINLSTVRAIERRTEIGIRKVIGSSRWQVGAQYLVESFLMNLIAVILAVIIYYLSIPVLELVFNINWPELPFVDIAFVLKASLIFIGGVLLSSLYPAMILSSFRPADVFRSAWYGSQHRSISFRQFLVIVQFVFCIGFCIATFTMFRQLVFMKEYNKGMTTEHVVAVKGYGFQDYRVLEKFKNELATSRTVSVIGASSSSPGEDVIDLAFNRNVGIAGKMSDPQKVKLVLISEDYFDALNVRFRAGKGFANEPSAKYQVIVNEAAARLLGYTDPSAILNEKITGLLDVDPTVIGVIKNYNHRSLKNDFDPIIFQFMGAHEYGWNKRYFFVKLKPTEGRARLQASLAEIKKAWMKAEPQKPFQYFFLDTYFDNQYKADEKATGLFIFFSSFVVFLSCLGLFGLVAYSTLQRTREIGIRKVLGATVVNILTLISRDFIKLIAIACAVTLPAVYWLLARWLEQYAFRIEVTIALVLIPLSWIFLVSIATVVIRSFKSATANPVNSLRS